ncbi:hypothetical protein PX116_33270, partial [Pseudomonas aeruginosa]
FLVVIYKVRLAFYLKAAISGLHGAAVRSLLDKRNVGNVDPGESYPYRSEYFFCGCRRGSGKRDTQTLPEQ